MNEYIKKTAQKGAQQNNALPIQGKTNGIPNSALQDVFAGKRHADSSMMGHSQNLAPSIAAKMSRAFGMDLTGMQVYRSDAMKGTGMRGMAQGNKVVLSSDVNLNTMEGQAVFGHEVSHIRAQSQGIGTGHSGLYENAALEHQADTEGMLAAQGRSIYSDGMDMGIGMQYGLGMQGVEGLTPLSGGMSASAGAPMQAKKGGGSMESLEEQVKSFGGGLTGALCNDNLDKNEVKTNLTAIGLGKNKPANKEEEKKIKQEEKIAKQEEVRKQKLDNISGGGIFDYLYYGEGENRKKFDEEVQKRINAATPKEQTGEDYVGGTDIFSAKNDAMKREKALNKRKYMRMVNKLPNYDN